MHCVIEKKKKKKHTHTHTHIHCNNRENYRKIKNMKTVVARKMFTLLSLIAAFTVQSSLSRRAKILQGPPLPPVINIGAAYNVKPFMGNLSMWATFSRPGIFLS